MNGKLHSIPATWSRVSNLHWHHEPSPHTRTPPEFKHGSVSVKQLEILGVAKIYQGRTALHHMQVQFLSMCPREMCLLSTALTQIFNTSARHNTTHASWGEGEDLTLFSVKYRETQHISASWLYPFSSLLLLSNVFSSWAGTPLDPGYPPSLMWQDALCPHTQPQSSAALQTCHRDFCTRTGVTLCSDEQMLQPSTLNPRSCILFLYLQSVPYTLDHKWLS